MKFVVSVIGSDGSVNLSTDILNTIVEDNEMVFINNELTVTKLDVIRAFAKAIKDHINEYRNNTVCGWC